jgi:hypothetical protein
MLRAEFFAYIALDWEETMKTRFPCLGNKFILPLVLFLALAPTKNVFGADFFTLKCGGENNNDSDPTLTLKANIDVEDRWSRDDGEGKGAKWIRVSKAKFFGVSFYSNRNSKARGEVATLTLNDFETFGSYDSEISDENENGIPDSILRTFEYSVNLNNSNFNISATNRGQGGKNDLVLHVYSSGEVAGEKKVAWTYCKLKRRWF